MTVIVTQQDLAMEKEKSQSAIMVSWDEVPSRRNFLTVAVAASYLQGRGQVTKNITAFYIKKGTPWILVCFESNLVYVPSITWCGQTSVKFSYKT